MLLVLVRVKIPVPASIRDKNIKKEQFVFLKEFKCLNTANDIEKSAHDYNCMEFPWLQIVIFLLFFLLWRCFEHSFYYAAFLVCGDKHG